MELHGVFNVYLSSLEPNLGMYVSSVQVDPENQAVEITSPAGYGKELVEQIGLFHTLGMPEDTKAVTEGKLPVQAFLEQVKTIEKEREKMFRYELSRFSKGVLAVVFDAGDRLSHIFWNNADEGAQRIVSPEIEAYYRDKDRLLGEVLSEMDQDTNIIILSDHGFSDFQRQVNLNTWLVKEGYMKVSGEGDSHLFGQVDWSETSVYSLGFTSVFLNLEGRESQGIVPLADSEALIEELIKRLSRLKDGKSRVITQAYSSRQAYRGKYVESAPDIIVGFAPRYRMSWRNAVGGLDDTVFSDNESEWKGDHLIDPSHVPGVLFTNFPLNSDEPSLIDIAPTILSLMRVDQPECFEGVSLV